jgi:hypothetical protein
LEEIILKCLANDKSQIIFSFNLLPILYLNETLKNIIISIQLNYESFFLTFFFAFIIMYIFSNIYFFFLPSDFDFELSYMDYNKTVNNNYFDSLIFGFLNALDNGLRARGGLGDSGKKLSFIKSQNHYIFRVLLDDVFFLLIVIIMIDLSFGIILKSFDKLRYRNQKYHSDKHNFCFICHSNKELLAKYQIKFKEHVEKTHNVWNYVEFMILLKFKDIHELNAISQYVRGKIDKKDISWFPSYINLNQDRENNSDDSNLIISDENEYKYKIKSFSENDKLSQSNNIFS